jgi:flagellar assembly protein FliH
MTARHPLTARRLTAEAVSQGPARALTIPVHASNGTVIDDVEAEEFRIGFERGYSDGLRSVKADAEAELARFQDEWRTTAQAALDEALAEAEQARQHYLNSAATLSNTVAEDRLWAEGFAVELGFAAVVRLLGERANDRVLIAQLCQQARAEVGDGAMRLRVAPADIEDVGSAAATIELVADPALPRGSCVLETPRGRFDASLAVRLDHLRQAMLQALQAGSPESSHARDA